MQIDNPNFFESEILMNNLNAQYAEFAKTNIDAASEVAGVTLNGVEKLAQLQFKSFKDSLGQSASNMKALAAVKDIQELVKVQSTLAMPSLESAVAFANAIYAVSSETANAFAKLAEAQISAGNEKIHSAVEEFAKSAPAGAESSVALVKSALTAASAAYETANKAAKQAVAVVEENVQTASKASLKALKAAA
jgi:phasin family protein